MGTKRTHDEAEGVHSDRRVNIISNEPKPSKKPRKTGPSVPRKQVHDHSVNAIKKRIRDVRRRLERAKDLPANIRVEDERALAAFEQELAAAEEEGIRQKMIKKYHMVRFVERRKATRHMKRFRKRLLEAKTEEEVETAKALLHVAEVDLNYTQYFPLMEVYVGLYGKSSDGEEQEVDNDEDNGIERVKPPMWAEVEKAMEEGNLDRLRNRRLQSSVSSRPKPQKAKSKPFTKPISVSKPEKIEEVSIRHRPNRSERRRKIPDTRKEVVEEPRREEEANLSDGGFFEE